MRGGAPRFHPHPRHGRDLMGFDSRYNFSFSPSEKRLIFHDSVASYTVVDNGSDFYLLNSASRFLAFTFRSLASRLAVPRSSYVCRVSNDAYRMDWKAMVGIHYRSFSAREYQAARRGGADRTGRGEVGSKTGGEREDERGERANPSWKLLYRKRPALVLGAVGCRATR